MNYSTDYKKYDSELAEIYYTDKDTKYIGIVKNIIDEYYPKLLQDFDLNDLKVKIIIYPSRNELQNAVGYPNDKKIPMGIYYGGVINLLSFSEYSDIYEYDYILKNGPVIHEITHFLLDKKTKGNFEVWFAEGVALYYEYKYTSFVWREDLKEKSKVLDYEQLKNNFRNLDENISYRRSFDIINNYVNIKGENELQFIISKF